MERARAEISHWDAYDYVVINDDVDACFAKVREILEAERMKRAATDRADPLRARTDGLIWREYRAY